VIFAIVFFILAAGAAGWFTIFVLMAGARAKKKARQNAPAILDKAFNGDGVVVFKIKSESPDFEDVVLGAQSRGYRMTRQTDTSEFTKTLIFEKEPHPAEG